MTTQTAQTNLRSENRSDLLRLAVQMAEEMERIGGRMRERREELGLKQREVAELIPGKTEGKDISRWENGRHRPESDTLGLIAKALETDVADLYAGPLSEREEPEDNDLMGRLSETKAPGLQKQLELLARGQAEILAALAELRESPKGEQKKREHGG